LSGIDNDGSNQESDCDGPLVAGYNSPPDPFPDTWAREKGVSS
jgi:hypothetical protein